MNRRTVRLLVGTTYYRMGRQHRKAGEESYRFTVTSAAILNGLERMVSQRGRRNGEKRLRTDVVSIPVVTVRMITFVRKSSCFCSPERALCKWHATAPDSTHSVTIAEHSAAIP